MAPPPVCDTSDDESVLQSAGFVCDESEDDLDDMTLDDKFEEMGEEEKRERNYISNYLEDFADEEDIFSAAEVEALKKRERQIAERNDMSYYRCKDKHRRLYNELTQAFAPFITHKMMMMLHHPYDTQKNEALNNSVAAYAPKSRTYSLTNSLLCRVSIVAGVQILGYASFWSNVFSEFGLDLDSNLRHSLLARDKRKERRTVRYSTKEGKQARGRLKNEKYAAARINFFEELRTGMAYESGIALKAATKTVKDSPAIRNPKGTLSQDLRCKYHHRDYCDKRGHADARSPSCYAPT